MQLECPLQLHAPLLPSARLFLFSSLSHLEDSQRPINLFGIIGRRKATSLLACDCLRCTQVTFFDQRRVRELCLPRGCKSELGDPPAFSSRPVIRLRPRPRSTPRDAREASSFYTCERRMKFIPCDNSRQDAPRAKAPPRLR